MGACITVHALGPKEQMLIYSPTGRSVKNGPGIKVVGFGRRGKRRAALQLGPGEYVTVKTETTGELRNIVGPGLFHLGPYDKVTRTLKGITLQREQYVRLIDDVTGRIRVEVGEKCVYMGPTESYLEDGKKTAVSIDEDTAVLVRDMATGQLQLVTERGLFIPNKDQDIVNVQKRIKLADYETAIVKDQWGSYHFISGALQGRILASDVEIASMGAADGKPEAPLVSTMVEDLGVDFAESKTDTGMNKAAPSGAVGREQGRGAKTLKFDLMRNANGGGASFFLPPFCELVELLWSTGPKKNSRTKKKSIFDSRPIFTNYEFLCRTSDNVELDVEITFFWSLENVQKMIRNTDDAPGDICHHARSEIVQSVSQIDLRKFMESFNEVVTAAAQRGESFYHDRGVKVHSVEVRSFQCRDKQIDRVLQAIIKETTDRINRLQQIESENEVRLENMKGLIEEEKLKGGLIDVRNQHQQKEAMIEGEAEALRVRAFLKGLEDITPDKRDAIQLFHMLRKVDVLSELSRGDARLFFTPDDCDLRIHCGDEGSKRAKAPQKIRSSRLVQDSGGEMKGGP